MAYGESNGHVSNDVMRRQKVKLVTQIIDMLSTQYLENSQRCYSATIANYYLVCCEAVRSAILVTAGAF